MNVCEKAQCVKVKQNFNIALRMGLVSIGFDWMKNKRKRKDIWSCVKILMLRFSDLMLSLTVFLPALEYCGGRIVFFRAART